jgi:ADP-heptose:LPS heptosyltransferase
MIRQRGSPTLHYLDRYCGIPAIAILGSLRRKRKLPQKIDRIGLLRLAGIGDTVLISAAVADLRAAFPHASLTFFSGPTNLEFVKMMDGLDRIVEVPVRNVAAGLKAIRSVPVDVMIDFGPWPRLEALFTLFSKASYTIGFRASGQYRHYGYDLTVDHSSKVHELDNFRRLVCALGVKAIRLPSLNSPQNGKHADSPYVVFHLWPGGRRKELKQWPSERWIRLIDEFVAFGVKVVLTGAPSDCISNDSIIHRLQSRARGFVRNAAGISLPETAAMLAHSCLVVSVNTGVMHMSAALGVPLVALHGPTSSQRWGPISERAIAINSPLHGCGYLNLGWEYPTQPPACMECISFETVRDACLAIMKKEPRSPLVELQSSSFEGIADETRR